MRIANMLRISRSVVYEIRKNAGLASNRERGLPDVSATKRIIEFLRKQDAPVSTPVITEVCFAGLTNARARAWERMRYLLKSGVVVCSHPPYGRGKAYWILKSKT